MRIAGGGQITSVGAVGFPNGYIEPDPNNFIYIPNGTYNIYLNNTGHHFIPVTPTMLLGGQTSNSFSLSDSGNGTYCSTNLVLEANSTNTLFYLNNGVSGAFFGISSFP